MAKFCTKCGKKLEEGKKCDCESQKSEKVSEKKSEKVVENKAVETSSSFDVQACFNSYVEMIKGIFTKPVDTIKAFAVEENFILAIIAVVMNSLVSGIFLYCFEKEAFGSLSGLGILSLGFGSLEIPFMKTFLYGMISMLAGFFVTAFMMFILVECVMKKNMSFKKALSIVGVCSVFTTVTTLACVIFVYLSLKLALIVLLIAGVIYLAHLYQGLSDEAKIDKNKLAYVFTCTVAVTTFVVLYIVPKIFF